MSYEPLHHKYRPQTFAGLVGQEAIATTLTNAILSEKIAPAYLFTGPRGTGKTSSARILAKSLNCLKSNKPTPQPCGVCVVCQGIANGSALDVIEIDAASNTGVDNIREIIERAAFAPVQCRYKVYAIDECHMLSTAAFNALLKTLEEPPLRVVFILATTDPQRVLPTIISRCQRFDFRRIAIDAMVKHLSAIASEENINIAPEALHLVASFAQGGLRDAESLLDQLSLLSGEVTIERVWDLVGSVSEPDLLELLKAIAHNQPEALIDRARQIMDRGKEPIAFLQNLASFYRDLLIAKTAPNRRDLVTVTPLTWKALCEQASTWDISNILIGQQHLAKSEVQIRNTTQPRLWLEVTLLGLLPAANITQPRISTTGLPRQPENVNGNGLVASQSQPQPRNDSHTAHQPAIEKIPAPVNSETPPIKQDEPQVTSVPAPTEAEENIPSATEAINAVNSAQSKEQWQQVLANLQPMSTRELLRQMGHLIEFNGTVARIGMKNQTLCNRAKPYLPNIKAAFQATFKQEVEVKLELATANQSKNTPVKEFSVTSKSNVPIASPQVKQSVASHASTIASQPAELITQSQPETTQEKSAAAEVLTSPQMDVVTNAATTTNEWDDHEVAIASQRLADFFKGEVVRLNDDAIFAQPTATETLAAPLDSDWYNADTEQEEETDFDF
ncbi:MAG TPA: DNA polymerase III subunit gamma/tau [Cyanobacteria bacterium UBA11049]|nr:DNA polymerase III subunit gamma/tau [Cyanobacteria bacterium UBA11049]